MVANCSKTGVSLFSVGYPFGGVTYQFVGKMTPFLLIAVLVVLEGGMSKYFFLFMYLFCFLNSEYFFEVICRLLCVTYI